MSRFSELEQVFELPRLEDVVEKESESLETLQDDARSLQEQYKQCDPFAMHDEEMDEIAGLALEYGKTLHDLGMNVEARVAGEIFNASGNMFKIAADARNSKMEKKLKLMKLELDRLKLDRTNPDPGETINEDHVTVLDRNALLDQIKSINNDSNK
jgi:hypothetical protein